MCELVDVMSAQHMHIDVVILCAASCTYCHSNTLSPPLTRVMCGIVARSAGLFQNKKKVCTCDGITIWDEAAKRQQYEDTMKSVL